MTLGSNWALLVAGAIGVAGSQLVEWQRNYWARRDGTEASRQARADEERRFQRETILALQEAMLDADRELWTVIGSLRAASVDERRAARSQLDPMFTRVQILGSRVTDVAAREHVENWKNEMILISVLDG